MEALRGTGWLGSCSGLDSCGSREWRCEEREGQRHVLVYLLFLRPLSFCSLCFHMQSPTSQFLFSSNLLGPWTSNLSSKLSHVPFLRHGWNPEFHFADFNDLRWHWHIRSTLPYYLHSFMNMELRVLGVLKKIFNFIYSPLTSPQ